MRVLRTSLALLIAIVLFLPSVSQAAGTPIKVTSVIGDKSTLQMRWTGNDTFQGKGKFVVDACRAGQCGKAGGIQVFNGLGNSSFQLVTYYQRGIRLQPGQWQLRANWVDPAGNALNYVDGPVFTVR